MEDQKMIAGIKDKNIKCYESIIDKYSRYIAQIVKTVSDNHLSVQDIEEICADVFIKLWMDGDKIQIKYSLKLYLGKMARNKAIDRLRKKKIYSISLQEDECGNDVSAEDIIFLRESQLDLEQTIYNMREPEQEIFIRRYFYLEKIKAIAKSLNMNENTVTTKLFRAKKKIEQELIERRVIK